MRKAIVTAMLVLLVSALAQPAGAVVFGEADDGDFPHVGALIAAWHPGVGIDPETDKPYLNALCSGTLLAPTVFLTAAHCVFDLESTYGVKPDEVFVSFAASDGGPTDDGISDRVWDSDDLISGTYHVYEGHRASTLYHQDFAVVVLDEAVELQNYGTLPRVGLLDDMKRAKSLQTATFTAVGYGTSSITPAAGGPIYVDPDTRMVASDLAFSALDRLFLHQSQNPALGNNGACFGDSGGPTFLNDSAGHATNVVAGLVSTGDAMCRATNVASRLDTQQAHDFINTFLND